MKIIILVLVILGIVSLNSRDIFYKIVKRIVGSHTLTRLAARRIVLIIIVLYFVGFFTHFLFFS